MPRETRVNELIALKEIAEVLNTSNDMDVILNEALMKLLQVTGFTSGWIFLLDDNVPGNTCAASLNLPEALTVGNYALMCGEDCWCVERYRQRKLQHAVNIIECKRINYAVSHQLGDTGDISHHATVPLNAGKDRFGLLNVAQAGKTHFDEEELALLQAISFQIGTAIKRIRLYQAQEQSALLYAKLGDVIQKLNAIQDSRQLSLLAVKEISDAFNWPYVALFIYDQERMLSLRATNANQNANKELRSLTVEEAGPVSTAFRENKLVIESRRDAFTCDSLASVGIPHYASSAAIPLRIRNRPIGVLFVSSPNSKQFDEFHEDFMYSLGDHYTLSMENLRVYEQRQELARMEERNRVARDLHDSVIQKVFSLSFLAKGAETVLSASEPVVRQSLQEIQQLAQEALKEMRGLIWQLHPPGLENGLMPALQQYGQGMNLDVFVQVEGVKELHRAVEEALWRIGQEAINNIRKHAGTNAAHIRLVKTETFACIEIMDKGKGLAPETRKSGLTMGMMSMRERAESLGGQLTITGGKGKPTIVKAEIPIKPAELEVCNGEEDL
ncbi:GAF domain-containing sensor histidine kinase [Paenibacillus sp. NEAU-GSW1]|uniref:GAF domain-containing sensor histidine kinase n=1 Tax=Paenibacillus sp. NEAU-GSW1 TaxID=2682486 RepID=UPI0012E27F9D|nr:GAF domain-containing sensor histidine kinase [Paenibacillus sp. NEAU-GSW1]MUT67613.1 GAF domain-containing protein [Paenibacillus sp. NEAU-GSW1]